jgi:D-psicose/D-tagatose/L-ribulose 3-epimerase
MQRFAICNETFEGWPWERVCSFVAETGYQGVEIAPFTFAESVADVSPTRRREIRQAAADAGLEIVGLHWLLASPKGLHVHTRDEGLRRKTVDYLRALVDFAGDIGAGVMIFGSPAQRRLEDGDREGAWARTQDSYRQVLPLLQERGVLLCQESLPAPEADFIMTAAEAARMVRELDHPHFREVYVLGRPAAGRDRPRACAPGGALPRK